MAKSKKSSEKSTERKIAGEDSPPSLRRLAPLHLLDLANPLHTKLGKGFFAEIPKSPGIYFFESAHGTILYVGKAKDLRARLQSYRRARPLEVTIKTRRLLYTTEKIRWELCPTEADALLKENAALRTLKPVFNVINKRPESYPFLCLKYKKHNKRIHFKVSRDPACLEEEDTLVYGAFKNKGLFRQAYGALLRILWFAAESERKVPSFDDAPPAIFRARPPREYQVRCEVKRLAQLQAYLSGVRGVSLVQELSEQLLNTIPPESFYYKVLLEDFQSLLDFYEGSLSYHKRLRRFHKMGKRAIPQDKIDDFMVLEKFRLRRPN